jgi:hypothetical protein
MDLSADAGCRESHGNCLFDKTRRLRHLLLGACEAINVVASSKIVLSDA